ncbi:MAG: hypothetical protein AAF639_14890 [Chloroflexota bacterium]
MNHTQKTMTWDESLAFALEQNAPRTCTQDKPQVNPVTYTVAVTIAPTTIRDAFKTKGMVTAFELAIYQAIKGEGRLIVHSIYDVSATEKDRVVVYCDEDAWIAPIPAEAVAHNRVTSIVLIRQSIEMTLTFQRHDLSDVLPDIAEIVIAEQVGIPTALPVQDAVPMSA